jgi:hypothetical protein
MRAKQKRYDLRNDSLIMSQTLLGSHCHEVVDIGIHLPKDGGRYQKDQEARNYTENEW